MVRRDCPTSDLATDVRRFCVRAVYARCMRGVCVNRKHRAWSGRSDCRPEHRPAPVRWYPARRFTPALSLCVEVAGSAICWHWDRCARRRVRVVRRALRRPGRVRCAGRVRRLANRLDATAMVSAAEKVVTYSLPFRGCGANQCFFPVQRRSGRRRRRSSRRYSEAPNINAMPPTMPRIADTMISPWRARPPRSV